MLMIYIILYLVAFVFFVGLASAIAGPFPGGVVMGACIIIHTIIEFKKGN
jgi:hypothetical protein